MKTQNSQRLTNHFKEMLITAEYVSQKSRTYWFYVTYKLNGWIS